MWPFGRSQSTELIAKLKALHAYEAPKEVLDQLYTLLSILDSKATGLLTVDTLYIAILTIIFADSSKSLVDVDNVRVVLEIQLALAVVSAFLCLLVVRVTWRFFLSVPSAPTSARDFDPEIERLARVVDDRTHYYWIAWAFALSAFVLTLTWWWLPFWVAVAAIALIIWISLRG